jgi:hypothetical protein
MTEYVNYNKLAEIQIEIEESLAKINMCTDMKFLEKLLNVANEEICGLESRMVLVQRTLIRRFQELKMLDIALQKLIDKIESTKSEVERNDLLKEINELEERIDMKKITFHSCEIDTIRISACLVKPVSERDAIEVRMLKLREEKEESVATQQRNETDEPNADLVLS